MRIYREITNDRGCMQCCGASDNFAEYQLTSAYAKDLRREYEERYNRQPSSAWYNRHFRFDRIR